MIPQHLAAVDWRDIGAITEVHSQGSCGACWAITAVETVESVHFIATGQLYDLSVRDKTQWQRMLLFLLLH